MNRYLQAQQSKKGLVQNGLIQRIVLSDYISGSVIPSRVGNNGTNFAAIKELDGSLACKKNRYFVLNNTLYGKTIEIVAKCSNINNIGYFNLGCDGSVSTDFTIVRTSNLLQRWPPLVSCGVGIWSTIHSVSCFLQNNTNTSLVKIFQNSQMLNSGTTSQSNSTLNIFIGTRDIATEYIYIYEIRLYNRELTQSEIIQNYRMDKVKYNI